MDKEDILLLTDKGLAVFKYYIPFSFKLGRNFLNPLYKDSKASCNVYFDRRNGMYKMKDFVQGNVALPTYVEKTRNGVEKHFEAVQELFFPEV